MNLTKKNIQNLTSLWETTSAYNRSLIRANEFDYITYKDYKWPNRLWFHQDVMIASLEEAKKVFSKHPQLIIPYWDIYDSHSYQLLEQNGFTKVFEQTGMSLKLTERFQINTQIKLTQVVTHKNAIVWSELFKAAFGYEIHSEIITDTLNSINYYIASYNDVNIGTVVTYKTNEILGVHSMGIVPNERNKGFAMNLMKIVLNQALDGNHEYVTLQASNKAKGLYTKLGFTIDFSMKNYGFKR